MHALMNIAIGAARLAGNSLLRSMKRLDRLQVHRKGHNDFVSEADTKAEALIVEHIHKHYPDHAILAEEGGASGESDHLWIIDPLDGTTNFLHGLPIFSVSIALKVRGRMEHACIYDPLREEIFSASRGQGAQLEGRKIRVSKTRKLADALIGTGFPYREKELDDGPYFTQLREVLKHSSGVRRPGSAALDLAYVAAGRLDGFWEYNLKPWDIAAGSLLIREAGGIVAGHSGSDEYMESGNIIAGNPKVFGELAKIIQ